MTYKQALKFLNEHRGNISQDVYLFISPPISTTNFHAFRATKSNEENKLLLEKHGLIHSDKLDVYATYREDNRIVYPKLSYFLQITNQNT